MNFEYDQIKDRGECVAFIDHDGDLIVATEDGTSVLFERDTAKVHGFGIFDPEPETHKFYRGDKVTITF